MYLSIRRTALLLCLAGAAAITSVPAHADSFAMGVNSGHRGGSVISVGFGDVAVGYRDGYWDNSHRWHRWQNAREHRNYRRHYTRGYSNWNHDRDGNDGWREDWRERRNHHRRRY